MQTDDSNEVSGDMSFLRSLNENKLFRNKSDLRRIEHDDSRDLLFLSALALYALSQESKTASWAQSYAALAAKYNGFADFKIGSNDLYNLAHIHFGNTSYGEIDVASQLKKNPNMQGMLIRMLRGISKEANMTTSATQLFIKLEKALGIDNSVYKALRREVSNWHELDPSAKKSALKRLYRYTMALSPRSEFLPILQQHIGIIAGLSTTQKTALGVGVLAGGFLAGYHMTRDKQ